MHYLTVDFGSTYTKLTLIDVANAQIVATASAFTTITTDVLEGFNNAWQKILAQQPDAHYDRLLSCSSAAGGLKMVALGLVPSLTSKAAKMAASSAGAKVVKTYAYEISHAEQEEIYEINPDLVLLCGGTDGGNKEVILANARRLAEIDRPFAIVAAGNKSASYDLEEIFAQCDKKCVVTENVMPEFGQLNILPARQCIMDLFISRIIDAKGLGAVQQRAELEIIPTPFAVLKACELLSKGIDEEHPGWGDLMAVDLGGATTDIYSMTDGAPSMDNVLIKGIPEPYSKRTVEGDLGMRYSLKALEDETDVKALARAYGVTPEAIVDWVERCATNPDTVAEPGSQEQVIEEALAHSAVDIAVERHAGVISKVYTPIGEMFTLVGKDLTQVPRLIGIGGALINSSDPARILTGSRFNPQRYEYAKPKEPQFYLDKRYIIASMGLLSQVAPEVALTILQREVLPI
ncbi:methylaspartate mutase accessory protein GlmL [uncultured Porphyromonas sp.]|uniref:methylaspartate mutase accessory protein GlmL n=1 Tax=uncultured Porphyromonas sp. TaxID=159274 RepID=UPI00262DB868|nr:methylaspartate mutase accessory protein GlmL [uncultured Porphyromonas sp.]